MDAMYKQAAPQLLNELARLLSQHNWTEEGCIPQGVVNFLNYSWQDLTAGAVQPKGPEKTLQKRRRSKGSLKSGGESPQRQVSASGKRETAGDRSPCVVGSAGSSERKPQVSLNPRVKKRKQNSNGGK